MNESSDPVTSSPGGPPSSTISQPKAKSANAAVFLATLTGDNKSMRQELDLLKRTVAMQRKAQASAD
ncbi:hypothetical protein BDZ94DRAFT_1264429, partial [Collybia nuda]